MKLKCLLCNKKYNHLGSHIFHAHGITAKEYKEKFELPYNLALISEEVKKKKQEAFKKDRKKYLKNLTKEYRFKKGQSRKRRISQTERKKFIAQIKKINKNRKPKQCPICKTIYNNLDSHLYNKHKLINIK